ncbi:MAG: hypothetical protein IKJ62_00595, partial [Alphaproteobacteria bacterium]|nr:hypothetical protein [Alphaproteobacteria bacterium]
LLAITIITWNTTAWGEVSGGQFGTEENDCVSSTNVPSGYTVTSNGGKHCSASKFMCSNTNNQCIESCTGCTVGDLSDEPLIDLSTGCSFYTCGSGGTSCNTECDTTRKTIDGWPGYVQYKSLSQNTCTCYTAYECAPNYSPDGSGVFCGRDLNTGTFGCKGCQANTPSCSAGQYLSGNSCVACTAGYRCPGDNNRYKCTSGTYSDAGQASCTSCPQDYPYSDEETTSDSYCYASKTSTGSQLPCSTPSGCAAAECGTCTPGTCNWRDYKSATDTSCTPSNCTKPVVSVTADENHYVSGITCPACSSYSSSYPSSAGGNITYNKCYGEFSKSGIQEECSPTSDNVESYTCGSCTPGSCTYTKYASGTIKEDCTPDNCTKPVASVSCQSGYYSDSDDKICILCESGYYCNGSGREQCPEIKQGSGERGTSEPGSKSKGDCYVPKSPKPLTATDDTGTYVCLYDAYYQTGTH